MRRRHFISLPLAILCTFPLVPGAAGAQDQPRVRIGVLSPGSATSRFSETLRATMRELGYVEGRNLSIEWRDAAGRIERFDDFAAELVHLGVDVLIATVPAAVMAAKRATSSTPIVMVNTPDPVQLGLVSSLARPDANITGTTTLSAELSVKQLQLLKEALPEASRVAVLWNPSNVWHSIAVSGLAAGATPLGVALQLLPASTPEAFGGAFTRMSENGAEAVLVLADPLSYYYRHEIAALASRYRVPAMYGLKEHTHVGGLMSYWADEMDLYQRTAVYVGKILKGLKPGDLPIEQPTRFELVINLRTARALGLMIPSALLARADAVIE